MKAKFYVIVVLGILLVSGIAMVNAGRPDSPKPGIDFNGPHFNLNLIGKSKEMPGDYDNPDRHTMFVPLDSTDMQFEINQDETNGNVVYDPDTGEPIYDVEYMEGIRIDITQGSEFAMIDEMPLMAMVHFK